MTFQEESLQFARDIQEMAKRHYPDDNSDMGFHVLETVVATLCSDCITDRTEMFREIYEMLEERGTKLVYNDLDCTAHTVAWRPESYRIHEGDTLFGFQLHTQNFSYWVVIKDYSHIRKEVEDCGGGELSANDEVYIYRAKITGPDYKNKTKMENFFGEHDTRLYLDHRDDFFLGCTYNWSDGDRKFPPRSNWDYLQIKYMLMDMMRLHYKLKQGET